MADGQYRFDFEREQRERRQLIEAISHERTGLSLRRWSNVQRVLVFLVNCDRGDGMIPYVGTIAKACSLGRRTVDRAIADAKSLDILTAETRRNKSGRASNAWSIDFAALAALGALTSGANQRQDGVDRRRSDVDQRQDGANPYKGLSTPIASLSNTSTTSSTAAANVRQRSEEEVEAIQRFKANVRAKLRAPLKLDQAVDTALANGCTLDQLRHRVSWFANNQRRWNTSDQPGVLYLGLLHAEPGMPPDQGWPYQHKRPGGIFG